MWVYSQLEGQLFHDDIFKGYGYSGHGIGYNNPNAESLKGVGVIPSGKYKIDAWEDHHKVLGVCVAHLSPVNPSDVFGRSGFFIHGDNQKMNHTASDGCIILNRLLRNLIQASKDNDLLVITSIKDL